MPSIRQKSKIAALLLCLWLVGVLCAACSSGGNTQPPSTGAPPAFHAALKTSDGMFLIQFSVTPDHSGLNTFMVNVDAANSGKPVTNLQVQLSMTMLDMDIGNRCSRPAVQWEWSLQRAGGPVDEWSLGDSYPAPHSGRDTARSTGETVHPGVSQRAF